MSFLSPEPILESQNNLEKLDNSLSSMNPSLNIKRDQMGNLQHVTMEFGSGPQNDIDVGRIEFLKDILKKIAEPNQNASVYSCNDQTRSTNIDGRK